MALWLIDRSAFVKRWEVSLYAGARQQLELLEGAIKSQPGAADPIISRGNFYAASAQPDLAVADYQAALRLDPQNPRALYNIGQMKLIQKNFPQAEKKFRAALTQATSDPEIAGRVHYGLAMSLFHLGKPTEALPEFDAAIARVPDVPEFYFWRGTVRRSMRDDAKARADFGRAEELARVSNPDLAARARELLNT
jgi:tetratricopeptide (TPR) repeat protein